MGGIEFLVVTEKGGYMVGSYKSKDAALSWAKDYFDHRGIKCLVISKEPHDPAKSV